MENHTEWLQIPGDKYHPFYILYYLILGNWKSAIELALLDIKVLQYFGKQDLFKTTSEKAYTCISALFLFHPY